MMEVLQRGSATRLPALDILQAIFEVCYPEHCSQDNAAKQVLACPFSVNLFIC